MYKHKQILHGLFNEAFSYLESSARAIRRFMRSPYCLCVSPIILLYMRSVSHQKKVGNYFFPETLVIFKERLLMEM
jgi:hypothetical protein